VALALCTAVFAADTAYAPGVNGAEARGAQQVVSGNWVRGAAIDGWDFVGTGPATGPAVFDVAADVTIWESDVWNGNQFYFHFGNSGTSGQQAAVITGSVTSNSAEDMQIYCPDPACNINMLKLSGNDVSGDGGAATIPLKWQYFAGGAWQDCQAHDGTPNRLWAYRNLPAGANTGLQIQCIATPATYQADGHYTLDPVIACTPAILH
jgi:hypothetical protein